MKFCYLDETGTGQETVVIIVGVIVDVQRMNRTKREWDNLLPELNCLLGQSVAEVKANKLIPNGNKWNTDRGRLKLEVVDKILNWLATRKHKITFAAVDKSRFKDLGECNQFKQAMMKEWNTAAFHILLSLQRCYQTEKNNKGNTVFIFDKGKEPPKLLDLVKSPPTWSQNYYDPKGKRGGLDQIVDVPFYADSKLLPLIQLADLICFILRRYAELKDYDASENCDGELDRYEVWVGMIKRLCINRSHRYMKQKPDDTSKFFASLAPKCLLKL